MLHGMKHIPLEPLERGVLAAQLVGYTCTACAGNVPARDSDVCTWCEDALAVSLSRHLLAVAPKRAAQRMDEFAMRFHVEQGRSL